MQVGSVLENNSKQTNKQANKRTLIARFSVWLGWILHFLRSRKKGRSLSYFLKLFVVTVVIIIIIAWTVQYLMECIEFFYYTQLFTFYKYASGVMRQGIGNNCCIFSLQSKPISYLLKTETLSILQFFFFFSPSKQTIFQAAVSICIQFLQIQLQGNNTTWIEKSTFHTVTVTNIAWNIHICAPHFLYISASLLQLSLLFVLPWTEFQNNYTHSEQMLFMKEIPVEKDSRVDTGHISNSCTKI